MDKVKAIVSGAITGLFGDEAGAVTTKSIITNVFTDIGYANAAILFLRLVGVMEDPTTAALANIQEQLNIINSKLTAMDGKLDTIISEMAKISGQQKFIDRTTAARDYRTAFNNYNVNYKENGLNVLVTQFKSMQTDAIKNWYNSETAAGRVYTITDNSSVTLLYDLVDAGTANEKYVGDALFQKTYTDDHFRRHQNNDHLPTHLICDHHEPIVSREDFEKANAIIRQHAKEKGMTPGTRSSINRYAFSGKIVCDHCGAKFIRRIQNNGNEIAWSCQTHLTDIHSCPIKYILDDAIKTALVTMFNKLIFSRKLLLKPLLERIRNTSSDENVRRMQELQQLLEGITGKKNTLRQLRAQGIIDTVMYNQELNRLNKSADGFKAELQALGQYTSSDAAEIKALESLIRFTENSPYLDEYSDTLFTDFVDHIVVYDRNNIGFKLKCGLLLREVI